MLLRSSSNPSLNSLIFNHQSSPDHNNHNHHFFIKKSPSFSLLLTKTSSETDLTHMISRRHSLSGSANKCTRSSSFLDVVEDEEMICSVGGYCDGDGRMCGGYVGGKGGGEGDHHGTDLYYKTMIDANPGNSLILGNYAKYLKEKQPTVALSSCESEFMAATGAACQALWLKRLLSELTGWNEEKITLKRRTAKSRYSNKGSTKIEVRDNATNVRSSRLRTQQQARLRRRIHSLSGSANKCTRSSSFLDVVEDEEMICSVGGGGDGDGRMRGGYGGGKGGGEGDHHGTDLYYKAMIDANPGNSLLLGNYAKYFRELPINFIFFTRSMSKK
nr:zinc finger, CCHC-type [Tanacetum cinerariifolium]